jgi:WD40 repeat protein
VKTSLFVFNCYLLLGVNCFSQNALTVFEKNGKYGFVDQNGNVKIAIKYDYCSEFSNGLAKVQIGSKYGFINSTGKEVISIKYDEVGDFLNRIVLVKLNNKFGAIDRNGKEVLPVKCDYIGNFDSGAALVKIGLKVGYIDSSGKVLLPIIYNFVNWVNAEIALINTGGKRSYPSSFGDGIVWGGKWGLINYKFEMIIPLQYDFIEYLGYGLFKTTIGGSPKMLGDGFNVFVSATGGKNSLVSEKGKEITQRKYDDIYPFYEDRAFVRIGKKYGMLDTVGKEFIPVKYDKIDNFQDGEAFVYVGSKRGIISIDGSEFLPIKYNEIIKLENGFYKIKVGEKWGYVNSAGKEIIKPIYDNVSEIKDGGIKVKMFQQQSIEDKELYFDTLGVALDLKIIRPDIVLKGHTSLISEVQINPSGNLLASCSFDKTIILWDIHSYKRLFVFNNHSGYVNSIAFSPDGKTLASASWDRTIKFFDLISQKEKYTIVPEEKKGFISSFGERQKIKFTKDGNILASGDDNGYVRLWDVKNYKLIREIKLLDGQGVTSLVFTTLDKLLYVAVAGGGMGFNADVPQIYSIDVQSGKILAELKGHEYNNVSDLALSYDDQLLVSCSGVDGTVIIWKVINNTEVYRFNAFIGDGIRSICFSPNSKNLVCGSNQGVIKIFNTKDHNKIATLNANLSDRLNNSVYSISFSPDARILAVGTGDGILIWDFSKISTK